MERIPEARKGMKDLTSAGVVAFLVLVVSFAVLGLIEMLVLLTPLLGIWFTSLLGVSLFGGVVFLSLQERKRNE